MMRPPDSFLEAVRSAGRVLLTGHEHPDGDCLGAQTALYHLLNALGKDVVIVNPDPPSSSFDFLGEHTPFGFWEASKAPAPVDLALMLDCNEVSRLGRFSRHIESLAPAVGIIDHHVTDLQGDAIWIDSTAAATGEMVYRLFDALDVEFTRQAAEGVWVSITSDTGWFKYSNTDEAVLQMAAHATRVGVDPSRIYDLVHRRKPAETVAFHAECLTECRTALDGRFGYVVISRAAMEKSSRLGFDLDVVMEPLRSVAGIEVVAMFKCSYEGGVKLSLRATGDVDVQKIAASFGGGGHKKAAGAAVRGSADEVVDRVLQAVSQSLAEGSR